MVAERTSCCSTRLFATQAIAALRRRRQTPCLMHYDEIIGCRTLERWPTIESHAQASGVSYDEESERLL
jgi:hypothetical protein